MGFLTPLLLATTLYAPVTLRSGNYVVHAGSENLARSILLRAEQTRLPALPAIAPTYNRTIEIYLAASDAEFTQLTAGRAPEWGAGVASPEDGIIILRAYSGPHSDFQEWPRVLTHELAHIALHRQLGDALIPRWFDEGFAEWSAGELDAEAAWMMRVAFATRHAPALDSLELSWPVMATDARVAYSLAASVVQYLVRQSGERGLAIMLQRWRETSSFERALALTYGLSVDQLETHWRKDVKKRYGWLAIISQTSVAFTATGIGVVALYVIRRRRDRRKMAQLRATELPDEPAYWAEPEDADIFPHGQENPDPTDHDHDR